MMLRALQSPLEGMAVTKLIFEGRRFRITLTVLQAKSEIFTPNSRPVQQPDQVRPRVDWAHFQFFVDAIHGAPPNITVHNAQDLDALCKEFIFTEFGKTIAAFRKQQDPGHSDVVITELRDAIAEQKPQHERNICTVEPQLTALAGGGALQRDVKAVKSLIGALQRLDARQNRAIQQLMNGMRRLEAFVGGQRAALGLAKTRDRACRVASDVAGLRAAMADDRRKVEQVLQEASSLQAQLSDCLPKVKKDLTNLEQGLAKLKKEIKAMKLVLKPLARPVAYVAVPPAATAAAPAWRSSNSESPKRSFPTAGTCDGDSITAASPPKPVKPFPPSVKKGKIERGEEWEEE
jgi:ABC-type transporter Mla subunit MlaD